MTGWGRTAPTSATYVTAAGEADVLRAVATAGAGLIPRGLGRTYGDSAQSAGATVLDCTRLNDVKWLDVDSGLVTVGAGISLDTLMRLVLPVGWFVPVTPGTRFVTVGGAIASDIHGKNHHNDGSFCSFVDSFRLLTPDGQQRQVTRSDAETFWATAGGLGLTGVILEATFRLRRVETSHMIANTERAPDLEDCLARLEAADRRHVYTVAWIDCLSTGRSLGRSVITSGDHAARSDLGTRIRRKPRAFSPKSRLVAPAAVPSGLMNRATVSRFNELWYRKAPARREHEIQSISRFFHPLDGIRDWNLLYGPRGFIQHQCVVPFGAESVLRSIVERLAASGSASFLAVLKRLGPGNDGYISFPMEGWTLTLDLPVGSSHLAAVLDDLDELVVSVGGRVYLAKDSRLRHELLAAMYPRLAEWKEIRSRLDPHGAMRSDQSQRLHLTT